MNDPWKEQAARNARLNPWTDLDEARRDAKRAAEEAAYKAWLAKHPAIKEETEDEDEDEETEA
jgi:hypothetical protein